MVSLTFTWMWAQLGWFGFCVCCRGVAHGLGRRWRWAVGHSVGSPSALFGAPGGNEYEWETCGAMEVALK